MENKCLIGYSLYFVLATVNLKMAYTEQQIETAINNVKHKAPIVREFSGYIVLGQNERDFESKCRKIANGDRLGFYTIERALANCG